MLKNHVNIKNYDFEIWKIIKKEIIRQEEHIELIASENYVSPYVMQVQGSQLTNKYAEGYPGKRYYGGCDYIDMIENLAIKRAKILFKSEYVNVQSHSGSQANFAVYFSLLNPGDTILGMELSEGGHLTHGSSVNFSGKLYRFIPYKLNREGYIDYEYLEKIANIYKPKLIIGGFSSYSRIVDWKKMREISDSIGAYFFVDMAHIAGLVCTNLYPSPLPYAHVVSATTHKTLAGPRGGLILSKIGDERLYKKIDSSVFPGSQGGPFMHTIAAKAVAFKEAMDPNFKTYQKQVIKNSKEMSKIFIDRNFSIVSGGTDNHLFLLNLIDKNLTGKEAENILSKANIIVNKNSIPNDPKNPFITSGIRIGTPAITKRGLKEEESAKLANWICDILENINKQSVIKSIKKKILKICSYHPVYEKNKNFL